MDESILFSLGFLSQNSLWKLFFFFVSKKGIYTGVRMKCEKSGISKQGWLAAWPLGLTELRVLAVR